MWLAMGSRAIMSVLLLLFSLFGSNFGGTQTCTDWSSAFPHTGIVCRVTYPAALVLNEKTAEVIQAAFQHARYPDITGKRSVPLIGMAQYTLKNLQIHNLSIGQSEVELQGDDHVKISISDVAAIFQGTLRYEYGNWLLKVAQSVDFEIESNIDLSINPRLHCSNGKVAADSSDCYLTFQKLRLVLQGERNPGWLKRAFTEVLSFTLKMVVKRQICKEINNLGNILAEFIQETAEHFISDGDIGMDISITSSPYITPRYIESYHKGLTRYNNHTAMINASVFSPAQLTDHRMLYFWISDDVLKPLLTAAHQDGRFACSILGKELTGLFDMDLPTNIPAPLDQLLVSGNSVLKAWSMSVPQLWTTPQGTFVHSTAAVEITSDSEGADTPGLYFETEVEVVIRTDYAEKMLILNATATRVSIPNGFLSPGNQQLSKDHIDYLKDAVKKIGIPRVISYLEPGLTTIMNRQGLDLFEIMNPEISPHQGYVIVQLDFGFPQHLLEGFLKKSLA
ncbi:hypothetical protein GJAV_G00064470 [Gymnothorax javanicus]|nr:hypothetical protein GJAV_G00064470 [Gymnothorax javanicus]